MSRRMRRGVSRGPKNNIWSVVQIEDTSISTTPVLAVIAKSSEWQGSGTSFQHATLLRIRGWLSLAKNISQLASGSCQMAIYVVDEDAANISALSTALYTDEDVIWTGGVQFPDTGVGNVEGAGGPTQFDVDVKSMRKIRTGSEVRLTLTSSETGLCQASGVIRALIRKGGN